MLQLPVCSVAAFLKLIIMYGGTNEVFIRDHLCISPTAIPYGPTSLCVVFARLGLNIGL